ncbi:MAG: hypothetical protein U0794_10665 [Isosphaeraceae bacterium]
MTPTCAATFDGPDGWRLDADGGALHDATGTAVIADVHLGYEWARGHSGDVVPALAGRDHHPDRSNP